MFLIAKGMADDSPSNKEIFERFLKAVRWYNVLKDGEKKLRSDSAEDRFRAKERAAEYNQYLLKKGDLFADPKTKVEFMQSDTSVENAYQTGITSEGLRAHTLFRPNRDKIIAETPDFGLESIVSSIPPMRIRGDEEHNALVDSHEAYLKGLELRVRVREDGSKIKPEHSDLVEALIPYVEIALRDAINKDEDFAGKDNDETRKRVYHNQLNLATYLLRSSHELCLLQRFEPIIKILKDSFYQKLGPHKAKYARANLTQIAERKETEDDAMQIIEKAADIAKR